MKILRAVDYFGTGVFAMAGTVVGAQAGMNAIGAGPASAGAVGVPATGMSSRRITGASPSSEMGKRWRSAVVVSTIVGCTPVRGAFFVPYFLELSRHVRPVEARVEQHHGNILALELLR